MFPFTSSSSSKASDSVQRTSEVNRSVSSRWNLLRGTVKPSISISPFPKALTDQIATEIYELIIDHLHADKPALLACSLVCRSWVPRSKCLLLELMICHPVPVVSHGGFGKTTCAVPEGSTGGIIYGTTDGVYRGSKDGSRPRLLSIHDVSQIEILPDSNLFLCLAGSNFITMPLSALKSGTSGETDITRIAKHVSFFAVYRSTTAGESHRVCALKSSTLSGTIKVFDVSGNNHVSVLVNTMELYIPLETYSVRFLSRTRIVAAIKKGFAVMGGFEMVDLVTADTQSLLDPDDPSHIELSLKKFKAMTVFRLSSTFLVCYDKFAFYIDRRGNMTRKKLVMRFTQPSNAFALHEPYILAFCNTRVEVWNIETAELVQKVQGPYQLINAPDSGEKMFSLSLLSGDVTEIVFHQRAS
ncbi:CNH domain-containing protein [Mycena capillaripes]|nr:CNH domain-containing protein [Mycena capillaripes]